MYKDPGDCNSSQLTTTTINEVDDLKDKNLNEEKAVVAEGATSVVHLGLLASKSKVTQLESEDEFSAVSDCAGDDVLELVTEHGGAPDYLCMNTCSGDASEVVPSRTQLLERPGWHAIGYKSSERQAWGEVADTVANGCDVCCLGPSWAACSSPPPGNMITIYLETGVLKQEIDTMLEQAPHPTLPPTSHLHLTPSPTSSPTSGQTPTAAPAPAP